MCDGFVQHCKINMDIFPPTQRRPICLYRWSPVGWTNRDDRQPVPFSKSFGRSFSIVFGDGKAEARRTNGRRRISQSATKCTLHADATSRSEKERKRSRSLAAPSAPSALGNDDGHVARASAGRGRNVTRVQHEAAGGVAATRAAWWGTNGGVLDAITWHAPCRYVYIL